MNTDHLTVDTMTLNPAYKSPRIKNCDEIIDSFTDTGSALCVDNGE